MSLLARDVDDNNVRDYVVAKSPGAVSVEVLYKSRPFCRLPPILDRDRPHRGGRPLRFSGAADVEADLHDVLGLICRRRIQERR
jgi:hypothetical protein